MQPEERTGFAAGTAQPAQGLAPLLAWAAVIALRAAAIALLAAPAVIGLALLSR